MLLSIFAVALALVCAINLAACVARALAGVIIREPAPGQSSPSVAPAAAIRPFVSIHIATHDEPASMVIDTIRALDQLSYPRFEVIIIDNNTPDPATWQPVERYVKALGPRFRFVHQDGVVGAKAGALNIALGMAHPDSCFVAIVDADYQVAPDFLATAIAHCRPGDAFVQFPQSYRDTAGVGAVVAELADYFDTYPSAANRDRASLLTGTLSLIRIDALRAVGGWPVTSITEDAELGTTLWASGRQGLYVDRAVGTGLLPVDLDGLRLQRRRWVSGNMQTLLRALPALANGTRGWRAVMLQLTAWVGFLAIPLLALLLIALLRLSAPPLAGSAATALLVAELAAAATILLDILARFLRLARKGAASGIAVALTMVWTGSFAWLAALRPRPLAFRRTPKQLAVGPTALSADDACSLAALAAAVLLFATGSILAPAALAISASGLVLGPLINARLVHAASRRQVTCS